MDMDLIFTAQLPDLAFVITFQFNHRPDFGRHILDLRLELDLIPTAIEDEKILVVIIKV